MTKIYTPLTILLFLFTSSYTTSAMSLKVSSAGVRVLNGVYQAQPFSMIPAGFTATCQKMRWNSQDMWNQLAVPSAPWFEHDNGSYIYLHRDGRWWMDDPSGAGVYVCPAQEGDTKVPSQGWEPLSRGQEPMPVVEHDGESSQL
jgi:hypothetical protein